MDDPLVTIARFHSPLDANLARAQLEAAGIRAVLGNEMANGFGAPVGVDLQVHESEEAEALAILGHEPADAAAAPAAPANWRDREELERCPVCESSLVQGAEPGSIGQMVRVILSLFLPLPEGLLASRRRSCGVCGFRWRQGDAGPETIPSIDG